MSTAPFHAAWTSSNQIRKALDDALAEKGRASRAEDFDRAAVCKQVAERLKTLWTESERLALLGSTGRVPAPLQLDRSHRPPLWLLACSGSRALLLLRPRARLRLPPPLQLLARYASPSIA